MQFILNERVPWLVDDEFSTQAVFVHFDISIFPISQQVCVCAAANEFVSINSTKIHYARFKLMKQSK